MARNSRHVKYRLITPPHMDVVVPFKSQDDALNEAKRRGTYHHTFLMEKRTDGEWVQIYDSSEDKDIESREDLLY